MLRAALGNASRAERDQLAETQTTLLKSAATALEASEDADASNAEEWRELACQAGVSPHALAAIAASLPDAETVRAWSFTQLLDFHRQSLIRRSGLLFGLVNPATADLTRIMPRRSSRSSGRTEYTEDVATWERRWQRALGEVVPAWLTGAPIKVIGEALHRHRAATGHVKAVQLGRRFALQAAGGLGQGLSLVARVIEQQLDGQTTEVLQAWLQLVAGCIREGFDDPDKLLLFWHLRRYAGLYPRVRVHQLYKDMIFGRLPAWQRVPNVETRRKAIRESIGDVAP
jgi:hypothetical protein